MAELEEIRTRRPGDVVLERRRKRATRLRQVLRVPALFAIGYGNVGSSIYYALGITAAAALGATPVAFAFAGLFFVFTALTYAEGAAMLPEAGGSSAFARRAFNELASFVAGWALMLDYIVTIAISAATIPGYLGTFWEPFKANPIIGTSTAITIVLGLVAINVIGIRETATINLTAAVIDLITQAVLVILGLLFLFNLPVFLNHVVIEWPSTRDLLFGLSIAMVAYIGLESVAQLAEEARQPEKRVPRALMLSVLVVLLMYAGITSVGMSAMPASELGSTWANDPVAGIADSFGDPEVESWTGWSLPILSQIMKPWVSILAASILLIAANAGVLGASRLAYSMATHHQLPQPITRVHSRFRTPYISILIFGGITLALLATGYFTERLLFQLGDLYAFGAMLAFSAAHASLLALRVKEPQLKRPFKLWSIRLRGVEIPPTAILGLLGTFAVWLIVLATHEWGRNVGFLWLGTGLLAYVLYRRRAGLSVTQPGRPATAPANPHPASKSSDP